MTKRAFGVAVLVALNAAAGASSAAPVGAGVQANVLIIAPRAAVGSGALSSRLAVDLNQRLNGIAGIQSIVYSTDLPVLREAASKHLITRRDLDDPNTFDVAEHIGSLLGVRFVVFGELENNVDDNTGLPGGVTPRLSLARIETSFVTPLVPGPAPPGALPGPDPVNQYAQRIAVVVIREMATPGAPPVESNPAAGHWQEAQRFLREGHIPNALLELRAAVAAAPDNGEYLSSLASLLMSQGRGPEAVALYQDAATAAPFDPKVRIALTRSLIANGDRSAALAAIEGAIPLAAGHTDSQVEIGRLLLGLGEKARAIQVLQQAADSGNAAAAAPLAEALEADGETAAAEAALKETIQRAPAAAKPREQLAAIEVRQGHAATAVSTLLDAIRVAAPLDSFGLLIGASAIDAEIGSILDALDSKSSQDTGQLKDRAGNVSRLIDALSLPADSGPAYAHRRAAVQDVLQAVQMREHPSPEGAGEVGVLIAQARQLLGLKAGVPAGAGVQGPSTPNPSTPNPSTPNPSTPNPSTSNPSAAPSGDESGQGRARP